MPLPYGPTDGQTMREVLENEERVLDSLGLSLRYLIESRMPWFTAADAALLRRMGIEPG